MSKSKNVEELRLLVERAKLHTRSVEDVCREFIDSNWDVELNNGILVLNLKGYWSNLKCFQNCVSSVMDFVSQKLGYVPEKKKRLQLVLNLRSVFFVSQKTVLDILYQYTAWLEYRFWNFCVVLPPSHYVCKNLNRAWEIFAKSGLPPLPIHHYVKRARDVPRYVKKRCKKK